MGVSHCFVFFHSFFALPYHPSSVINSMCRVVNKVACLFLIGSGCKLLHQAGHTSIALQIFEYIKIICKKMEPEYNHVS